MSEKQKVKKSRTGGVQIRLNDSWRCECGRVHTLGVYVAAHWDERLTHACDCGRKHDIHGGFLTLYKDVKEKKAR